MPNGNFLSDSEVEDIMKNLGIRFVRGPQPSSWTTTWFIRGEGEMITLLIENGRMNQNFLQVFTMVGDASRNPQLFNKAVSILNGHISGAKFVITNDRTIVVGAATFRARDMFHPAMLERMFDMVIAAVVFSRPILQGCLHNANFDVGQAVCHRVAELSSGRR